MLTWTVGRVTITRIPELELPIPYNAEKPFLRDATPEALQAMPWLYPDFVGEDGTLRLSVHALLVDAPGLRLVVDTCIGNDRPRGMTGEVALQTPFLAQLAEAGWSRERVDAVVCTHLHVDHVGWNTMLQDGKWVPTFPRARYLIGRAELEHWQAKGSAAQQVILGDSIQPIFDAGLAELVETDHRLSPEIRLEPTPGHTPGHVSVMIESEGERAIISGDFLHHPCQIAHPDWASASDIDPAAALATRQSTGARDRCAGAVHRHAFPRADRRLYSQRRCLAPARAPLTAARAVLPALRAIPRKPLPLDARLPCEQAGMAEDREGR